MKPLDKKDMPKLYALIGLAVCVLGYAIVSLTSGATNTQAAAAVPPPTKAASAGGGVAEAPAAGGAPAPPSAAGVAGSPALPGPALDVATMGPPTGGRDPFAPVGPAAKKGGAAPVAARMPALAPPAPAAPKPNTALATLLGLDKMRPNRPGADLLAGAPPPAASVTPAPVAPPPVPAVTVTGVVLGEVNGGQMRNVAILRGKDGKGGDDRRFVSVGDYVGNGFTVAAVYPDGVDLLDKAGSRRVTLKIGQQLQQQGENARAN